MGNGENEYSFFEIEYEFDDAKDFCNQIGGELFEPRDTYTMINITYYAKTMGIGDFWLGIHDKDVDGAFEYASNNLTIDWSNWPPSE